MDSIIQREHNLPSEKAFSYRMKIEAVTHQINIVVSIWREIAFQWMPQSGKRRRMPSPVWATSKAWMAAFSGSRFVGLSRTTNVLEDAAEEEVLRNILYGNALARFFQSVPKGVRRVRTLALYSFCKPYVAPAPGVENGYIPYAPCNPTAQ